METEDCGLKGSSQGLMRIIAESDILTVQCPSEDVCTADSDQAVFWVEIQHHETR